MKKYIPILGMFIADYPIKEKEFMLFFIYQVASCGFSTFFISYYLLKFLIS